MTHLFQTPSRRSVLAGGAALGLATMTGLPGLAQTPKRGGSIRIAHPNGLCVVKKHHGLQSMIVALDNGRV